jgi:putative phosphoribosyl transferase
MFVDRLDAARHLAAALHQYRDSKPLVLAIPRGAVPMAKLIAKELNGDFDVALVRKLRAPGQSELAIGAVDEGGWTWIAPYAASTGASHHYLEAEKEQQLATIAQRRAQYTPLRPRVDPAGRCVIVVDDGLATGATMLAALHGLRQQEPAQLVCAVPVASTDALERVRSEADAVVCLLAPLDFRAVGQYYADFAQVEDDEVVRLLRD